MKKEMLLVMVSFFLLSITAITGVYAIEEKAKVITISEEKADISGDDIDEVILLKGIPYQDDDSYLKEIYLEIAGSNGKVITFPLESGSKASLQLTDLNHDGIKDLYASVLTGGSGGIVNNYLYSLKNFVHNNLTIPEPLEMDAKFLNGYKAEIKLLQTDKTYLFDLKDRKKYYKKLGFYYKGKLNEPTELSVNPYSSLKPFQLKDGNMGLKGIQRVTGVANADTIALVETTWTYENDQWKLLNVNVKQENIPK
ncbi:hypothetical protein RCG19_22280 [Neobacillus sp. OS1-2]|uniref:hypothetical protein n=1 Tax=Neobacillus sp. OS1-2 TaxID=3070680 RepID=UPI0027E19186|nr:hypothetical protein [Neobacillus sp. OS1-2]WML39861.1 hypothetical protein RCG19_22280 [Neobacillus sp. OS1-2]